MHDNIKLSVIVPTLNRAVLLRQTLESIYGQTFPKENYEVIVIDNGSTDETRQVCLKYQQNNNLRYIYDERPGLHIGRNRGLLESRSDILVYADDDIIASPTWLAAIYEGFKDEKTVLIGGNNYPHFERTPPGWVKKLWTYSEKEKAKRLESYSVIVIGDEPRRVDAGMIFGCNFAIRKEIVERAGGFHPDGVPDIYLKYRGDGESYITSYIRRYNLKAMFYPDASIYHVITKQRLTRQYVGKVAYRAGISAGFATMREETSVLQICRVLKNAVFNVQKNKVNEKDSNIEKIKKFYYFKGFLYITLQFIFNRKVRKWIKRSDYMNAEIGR